MGDGFIDLGPRNECIPLSKPAAPARPVKHDKPVTYAYRSAS
jgi:hypothetical protein